MLENDNLIKLGHGFILLKNQLNKYKQLQLDPQYKITSDLSDIKPILPTLYESIDELVRGSYRNVCLSSNNIYNVYNDNIPMDAVEYDDENEFKINYNDEDEYDDYVPSCD
eukprot:199594_1